VRGLANSEVTVELAVAIGVAAARVLGNAVHKQDGERPRAVVGRDPRASGEFLDAAICAGIASAGVDVIRVGVLPTPAVAFLTADLDVDFGVMLSASHNPMPDNGIKIFARGGTKLPDELEESIEAAIDQHWKRPVGAGVGRIRDLEAPADPYLEHLAKALDTSLAGLKIVVDCANGAASEVGPAAYRQAGAEVVELHANPTGLNINDKCGSTHLEDTIAAVKLHKADLGLAHDGDADRCLAIDSEGNVVDGDEILAVLAVAMRDRGALAQDTVVVTVMSNLGFKLAMEAQDINVVETAVGDRYVLEAMREGNCTLGGEQSGHVILSDYATTGDGVLTGLNLASRMARSGSSLSELAAVMTKLPQVLINVSGVDRTLVGYSEVLTAALARAEAELGHTGRVLLRPSGTEALVRVMVEAPTELDARRVAEGLAQVVRDNISLA